MDIDYYNENVKTLKNGGGMITGSVLDEISDDQKADVEEEE
jgi:hypothetical protein